MNSTSPVSSRAPNGLVSLLFGFFGVTAAFLLLPRTIKFVIRKFVLGIFSEIVAVIVTGLLAEKLVDIIGREHSDSTASESSW